jgi:uncharacterized protein YwlG (UPF0340 family)
MKKNEFTGKVVGTNGNRVTIESNSEIAEYINTLMFNLKVGDNIKFEVSSINHLDKVITLDTIDC